MKCHCEDDWASAASLDPLIVNEGNSSGSILLLGREIWFYTGGTFLNENCEKCKIENLKERVVQEIIVEDEIIWKSIWIIDRE